MSDCDADVNGGIGHVVELSSTGALLAAYPDAKNNNDLFNQGTFGVAVDSAGRIYLADTFPNRSTHTARVVVLSLARRTI